SGSPRWSYCPMLGPGTLTTALFDFSFLTLQYPERGAILGLKLRWPFLADTKRQRIILQLVDSVERLLRAIRRQRDLLGFFGGVDLADAVEAVAGDVDLEALITVDRQLHIAIEAPGPPEQFDLFLDGLRIVWSSTTEEQQGNAQSRNNSSHVYIPLES